MLGVMGSRDAQAEAEKRGLDLVEISPTANPPVCKIMDFGKYKYELKKKSQGQKKAASNVLKELTLSPVTQEHDLQVKVRKALEFLEEGSRVKFVVRFRGRQMAHPEIGMQQLEKLESMLKDYATLELKPKMEGRMLSSTFVPVPGAFKAKSKEKPAPKTLAKEDKAK